MWVSALSLSVILYVLLSCVYQTCSCPVCQAYCMCQCPVFIRRTLRLCVSSCAVCVSVRLCCVYQCVMLCCVCVRLCCVCQAMLCVSGYAVCVRLCCVCQAVLCVSGYAWAEDKEHCEEYGRMLTADPSRVSSRAKKRGLPQVGLTLLY